MPERLYDDPDELARWARAAQAAAQRAMLRQHKPQRSAAERAKMVRNK
jgi:DNA transformation protein